MMICCYVANEFALPKLRQFFFSPTGVEQTVLFHLNILMEPDQFHRLREALGTFYWDNGFETFCRVTGFDPQFPHALEKWQQFSTCIQAMGQLDDRTWEKLLQASLVDQPPMESVLPR